MMPALLRRKFWAMVGDVAKQVPLVIGGYAVLAHPEDWRNVFCCALMRETRVAEGLDGQKVVLGLRLRDIFKGLDDEQTRERASLLLMIVQKFGDDNKVKWSDPKESALREQYAKEVASV